MSTETNSTGVEIPASETARTTWNMDPSHSELLFKVRHMMITNVKGEFRKLNASIDLVGNDLSTAAVHVDVETASIFTNDENRDKHLKSADFFDVEQFPKLSFTGTSVTKKGSDYELTGNLTIKGITKPVTLSVEFGGVNKDPWGNDKMGFSINGKINRAEWGLTWNSALESGGVLVSEEVRISAEVQFVKKA